MLALIIAMLLAATMGYAIQRGGTCTVAAVDEVLRKRTVNRLLSLLEAAVWVLGGLLIANAFNLMPPMPAGYAVTPWMLLGAALLGLGAAINRACVFGAIARFGSGQWAYLATPVGFYLGCLLWQVLAQMLGNTPMANHLPQKIAATSVAFQAPVALTWAIAAWMVWRLAKTAIAHIGEPKLIFAKVWLPHAATVVIGITFFFMLYLVGPWAYTDALADWARGMMNNTLQRGLLLLAMLAGAVYAGWTAGRLKAVQINLNDVARCLLGGALMGWGSVLIPGGNDGLILTGMPLLWPHAWLSFAVMCLTIAIFLEGSQHLRR